MTPAPADAGSTGAGADRARVLRAIAYYKFVKAALLVAAGLGALKLLQPRMAIVLGSWASDLGATRVHRIVVRLVSWLGGVHPRRLEAIAIGAFLFAALFLTEGVGLWLGRRWAQYLTVIATTLLVPPEVFQLVRHATLPRAAVLVLNLAVVALLVQHLRRHGARGGGPAV
ncbi:MAG TPA: DUF2127 domain-containing protein [Gemmatimonadales bacterium]|nr:DUF2127 domain-containing protein [Gemmatimonadales bacterium]